MPAVLFDASVLKSEIRLSVLRKGRDPLDLSGRWQGITWSSNAIGGFGSCTLTLDGLYRRLTVSYLDKIIVTYGESTMFEGRIEDIGVTLTKTGLATQLQAFGLARLLDDNSVRAIWSKRDLGWFQTPGGYGSTFDPSGSLFLTRAMQVTTGQFDPTNLVMAGVQMSGTGDGIPNLGGISADYYVPIGVTATKLLADLTMSGANVGAGKIQTVLLSSTDGSSWTRTAYTASSTVSQAVVSGANRVRLGAWNNSGGALIASSTDLVQWSNIRLLGTSLDEDATGGFYGDTILKYLIALVPDLSQGNIESGSDFTIQSIERAVRDSMRSVVNEVAGYYLREWAVWEQGRFDWKTPSLDETQWIIDLQQLAELNIRGTTDGGEKTSYVLYNDAASGLDAEQSVTSTDQRNPYVKNGDAQDVLTRPGFPMTSNTAAGLAAQVNASNGKWPPVTGSVTLPILAGVAHATGPVRPAFLIRGGDNVKLVGLPKTDYMTPGRDGETLFHVSSVDVDIQAGTVRLTLEGQTRTSDQLIARLAAVTRTLTIS